MSAGVALFLVAMAAVVVHIGVWLMLKPGQLKSPVMLGVVLMVLGLVIEWTVLVVSGSLS